MATGPNAGSDRRARVDQGNQFIDVYDVGFTMQGKPVNTANSKWTDIACRNNRFIRCNQVVEVWATYGDAANAGVCPAGSALCVPLSNITRRGTPAMVGRTRCGQIRAPNARSFFI
jgi:hypothetical protein